MAAQSYFLSKQLTTTPRTFGRSRLSSTVSVESDIKKDLDFSLQKSETKGSLNSSFSNETKYRVELNLSKPEIEMIRYTWGRMLSDDFLEEKRNNFPIAGLFPTPRSEEKKRKTKAAAAGLASSIFCTQFYSNLLSMDPEIEKLFPSVKHQAVAFAGVMTFAISQLENLTVLDEYLMKLGKRHSRVLGIESPMFEMMGEAFIITFQERFGARFTEELESLWIRFYLYLANSILQFGLDPILKIDESESSVYKSIVAYDEAYIPVSRTNTAQASVSSKPTFVSHSTTKVASKDSSSIDSYSKNSSSAEKTKTHLKSSRRNRILRFLGKKAK